LFRSLFSFFLLLSLGSLAVVLLINPFLSESAEDLDFSELLQFDRGDRLLLLFLVLDVVNIAHELLRKLVLLSRNKFRNEALLIRVLRVARSQHNLLQEGLQSLDIGLQ